MGVRSCLIPWICDFLSSRRQAVKINMVQSEWNYINGGVPQGTKLGPMLFLVMINDLELKSYNTSHWKYVDDITISVSLPRHGQSTLQSDLDVIQQWTERNEMKLNAKKCKEMTISFLRQSPDAAPLHINGQLLNPVTSFKVLGVIFNHQLKWSDNVDMMVKVPMKRKLSLSSLKENLK